MFIEANTNTPLKELIRAWQTRTGKSTYFGVPSVKNPADVWIYQEIFYELKPDVIIEIGVKHGGSALMYAHWCDNLNKGRVIGVDISLHLVSNTVFEHPRITLLEGDANQMFQQVKNLIKENERVLIIEDSAHTYQHTLNVLNNYSELLRPGDYFIVEDSICYKDVFPDAIYEVAAAIQEFLKKGTFVSDRTREEYVITWNPLGYLKRVQ